MSSCISASCTDHRVVHVGRLERSKSALVQVLGPPNYLYVYISALRTTTIFRFDKIHLYHFSPAYKFTERYFLQAPHLCVSSRVKDKTSAAAASAAAAAAAMGTVEAAAAATAAAAVIQIAPLGVSPYSQVGRPSMREHY